MARFKYASVALVVAGLTGMGVASAAIGGSGTAAPPASTTMAIPDSATPPPTEVEPDDTTAEIPPPVRSTDGCDGADVENHGQFVRGVAQATDRTPGGVPAAAQSSCGMPLGASDRDADEPDDDDADEPDDDHAPVMTPPGPNARAAGPTSRGVGR